MSRRFSGGSDEVHELLLTVAAFAAASGINTANVALEQRNRLFTRRFGPRGWYVHLALVLPAWIGFLLQLRRVGRRVHWPLPRSVRPFGTLLLTAAAGLWLAAYRRLGPTRTGNGNLFGHGNQELVTGGVFRFRANPMYDSYVLALVGAALRTANAVYLLLAAEALVLLHGIEAPVENQPITATLPAARPRRAGFGSRRLWRQLLLSGLREKQCQLLKLAA